MPEIAPPTVEKAQPGDLNTPAHARSSRPRHPLSSPEPHSSSQGQALNTLANESLDASRSDTLSIAQIIEGTGTINPSPIFVRSWLTYIKSLGDTALADKIERFLHHHEQNYVPSAYVPFAEDPAAVVDDTEGLPSSPTQAEPSIPVLPSAILVPDPSVSCHSQSGAHTPQQQPLYSLPQAASPTDADMADADMAALPPALSGEDMPQQPPHTTLTVCTPVAPVAVVAAGRPLSGLGMGPATTNPQVSKATPAGLVKQTPDGKLVKPKTPGLDSADKRGESVREATPKLRGSKVFQQTSVNPVPRSTQNLRMAPVPSPATHSVIRAVPIPPEDTAGTSHMSSTLNPLLPLALSKPQGRNSGKRLPASGSGMDRTPSYSASGGDYLELYDSMEQLGEEGRNNELIGRARSSKASTAGDGNSPEDSDQPCRDEPEDLEGDYDQQDVSGREDAEPSEDERLATPLADSILPKVKAKRTGVAVSTSAPSAAAAFRSSSASSSKAYLPAASSLVPGSTYISDLKLMREMGYDNASAKFALQAAGYNLGRAVDYLVAEFPDAVEDMLADTAPTASAAAAAAAADASTAAGGLGTDLDALQGAPIRQESSHSLKKALREMRRSQVESLFLQRAPTEELYAAMGSVLRENTVCEMDEGSEADVQGTGLDPDSQAEDNRQRTPGSTKLTLARMSRPRGAPSTGLELLAFHTRAAGTASQELNAANEGGLTSNPITFSATLPAGGIVADGKRPGSAAVSKMSGITPQQEVSDTTCQASGSGLGASNQQPALSSRNSLQTSGADSSVRRKAPGQQTLIGGLGKSSTAAAKWGKELQSCRDSAKRVEFGATGPRLNARKATTRQQGLGQAAETSQVLVVATPSPPPPHNFTQARQLIATSLLEQALPRRPSVWSMIVGQKPFLDKIKAEWLAGLFVVFEARIMALLDAQFKPGGSMILNLTQSVARLRMLQLEVARTVVQRDRHQAAVLYMMQQQKARADRTFATRQVARAKIVRVVAAKVGVLTSHMEDVVADTAHTRLVVDELAVSAAAVQKRLTRIEHTQERSRRDTIISINLLQRTIAASTKEINSNIVRSNADVSTIVRDCSMQCKTLLQQQGVTMTPELKGLFSQMEVAILAASPSPGTTAVVAAAVSRRQQVAAMTGTRLAGVAAAAIAAATAAAAAAAEMQAAAATHHALLSATAPPHAVRRGVHTDKLERGQPGTNIPPSTQATSTAFAAQPPHAFPLSRNNPTPFPNPSPAGLLPLSHEMGAAALLGPQRTATAFVRASVTASSSDSSIDILDYDTLDLPRNKPCNNVLNRLHQPQSDGGGARSATSFPTSSLGGASQGRSLHGVSTSEQLGPSSGFNLGTGVTALPTFNTQAFPSQKEFEAFIDSRPYSPSTHQSEQDPNPFPALTSAYRKGLSMSSQGSTNNTDNMQAAMTWLGSQQQQGFDLSAVQQMLTHEQLQVQALLLMGPNAQSCPGIQLPPTSVDPPSRSTYMGHPRSDSMDTPGILTEQSLIVQLRDLQTKREFNLTQLQKTSLTNYDLMLSLHKKQQHYEEWKNYQLQAGRPATLHGFKQMREDEEARLFAADTNWSNPAATGPFQTALSAFGVSSSTMPSTMPHNQPPAVVQQPRRAQQSSRNMTAAGPPPPLPTRGYNNR